MPRLLTSGVLGVITLGLLIFQYQLRHIEATAAAGLYNVLTPTLAASKAPIISGSTSVGLAPSDC